MEADQVDILAFAVPRDLQQIGESKETGFSCEIRRNLRKLDRLNGVDLDLAFVHAVTGPNPYARKTPNANAADNLSPTDSFAKTFGEDHAKRLHPIAWNAGSVDGNVLLPHRWSNRPSTRLLNAEMGLEKSERRTPPTRLKVTERDFRLNDRGAHQGERLLVKLARREGKRYLTTRESTRKHYNHGIVRPERRSVLAGVSLVRVSAGAPGSRLQPGERSFRAERSVESS